MTNWGARGAEEAGEGGETITNYQLPITNYRTLNSEFCPACGTSEATSLNPDG